MGAAPQRNNNKADQKVSNFLEAKDLAHDEYEDISKRTSMGEATTEDNLQAEKHYWQNFLLTKELEEAELNNLLYYTKIPSTIT